MIKRGASGETVGGTLYHGGMNMKLLNRENHRHGLRYDLLVMINDAYGMPQDWDKTRATYALGLVTDKELAVIYKAAGTKALDPQKLYTYSLPLFSKHNAKVHNIARVFGE